MQRIVRQKQIPDLNRPSMTLIVDSTLAFAQSDNSDGQREHHAHEASSFNMPQTLVLILILNSSFSQILSVIYAGINSKRNCNVLLPIKFISQY